ncbi:MAG: hypothetical protein A3G38_00430 [Omnitrophica WOR_2 bacterium RIFCSPLOWO2_12_FULL_51_8]|nr:MAG: hypothetical protein A3G38_00430 [Omnitrophica WOR_2 bacterium RIFCSPLOWO2_12_FULL_51_8]
MFITAIGLGAAILTMFSFLPQIFKIIKTRSAQDVSLTMLLQLSAGVTLWIIYGLFRGDPILIIANIVTLSTLVILLYLYFSYSAPSSKFHR